MKASGPLISFVIVTSSITGTRLIELSVISLKRSQSSSSRRPLKSGGMLSKRPVPSGMKAGSLSCS